MTDLYLIRPQSVTNNKIICLLRFKKNYKNRTHMEERNINCPGCRPSFQEGQTMPPEGIHIEYKNYYLPIKDHQPKWILMKTIIAFLNSKGGTIFMGVDDSTRQVIGVTAQLKEHDMFMLEFDQILDNIQPSVDLRHKQEVRVQFVPVLKDKTFQGKYIIKIIVKQGDPSKVYHFAQTVKFYNEDKKHHDQEFKVLWGFYRSNMGKVDSIKGTQLIRQVFQKAKNPSIVVQTFHAGCNPDPLMVSVRNMNIGFKNLKDVSLKNKILEFVQKKLKTLHLQTSYSVQQAADDADTVVLKFKSITEYKQADAYILEHQRQLSDMIAGGDSLLDQGYIDNTHFYKIGQSFNPSLRYLRNRSRSRNRSIQIPDKKMNQANSINSPQTGKSTSHQTKFKPKQPNSQQNLATNNKGQTNIVKNNIPKNNIAKNVPRQDLNQGDDLEDDQQDSQQQQDLSPQVKPQSPAKKFELKPEQFPAIQKQASQSSKKQASQSSKQSLQSVNIKVQPPNSKKLKEMKEQQPSIKEAISSNQQKQKQSYHISIGNIFEKSFDKMLHYLQNSLGDKLDKIPHKVEPVPSNQEAVIHFASLKDIEAFIKELSKDPHEKKVINGFGDGRVVHITVNKGTYVQDFSWAQDKPNKVEQKQAKKKQYHQKVQSPIKQSEKKYEGSISPNCKDSASGVGSFIQKAKLKSEGIKGCLFVISNVKLDLNDMQKKHFVEILRQIFKHYCAQNSTVQIVNQNTLIGVVEIRFGSDQERKHFADLMQSQIIKYHQFTEFFKGYKAYWGVPSGNIIIHHYRSEDKKVFKQEVDKLFLQNKEVSFLTSKFIKDKDSKYYLNLNFHPNSLVKGLQTLYSNVSKSPIRNYAAKEGVVVAPQINRI